MAIAVFIALSTLTYAQVSINYINISIYSNNTSYTQTMNITGNHLLIPTYQYCSSQENYILFNAYLDPLSNLGIVSVSLVLYNGSYISAPINYSPKYVSAVINCSIPIYGVYLNIGSYPPYPLEALVLPGSNTTYTLTQGSINISIPSIPGLNYLFSIVRVISISPATASVSNYLTAPINTEYSNVNIGSLSTYAEITTYITYSNNISVSADGTTYVIVTPYYYAQINNPQGFIIPTSEQPIIMLTGAPWIKYSVSNCTLINPNIPRITPWTNYLSYSPSCTVNMSVEPITINFIGGTLQKLTCNNVFITTQSGEIMGLSNSITVNPVSDRELYLVINGMRTIGIFLNSIPTTTITIPVPLISRTSISIMDELGNPINTVLYLNANGTLLLFTNDTCIYPGNYDIYALINDKLMNLGTQYIAQGSSLTVPVLSNYVLNVILPQQCPNLSLQLIVKYGDRNYVLPLTNNSILLNISNALIGDYIQVYLLGNGSLLYQSLLKVNNNSYGSIELEPHIINFVPVDLLNNELPTAILNVGDLYYEGPGRYCIPINSTVGLVIYGNDIYVVNVTGNRVYVRIWTLGALGIKSLLIILGLLTLLLIIMAILKGLSDNGDSGNDYYIIK